MTIDKLQGEYPIQQICQVLSISRSSYYDWRNAKTHRINPACQSMEDQVIAVFKAHKRRYGTRRIVAELRHQDVQTSRYKVRKALYRNGLKAIQPRSFVPKTTISDRLLLSRACFRFFPVKQMYAYLVYANENKILYNSMWTSI